MYCFGVLLELKVHLARIEAPPPGPPKPPPTPELAPWHKMDFEMEFKRPESKYTAGRAQNYPPPPTCVSDNEDELQTSNMWFANEPEPVPLGATTFVRALRDSEPDSTPYSRKGDILRIVGDRWRGDVDFQLLPLKPLGEAGRVRRDGFEGVEDEAVEEVGRSARTEEEKQAFRRAVEWED